MANLPVSYPKTGASTGASGLKCHGKLTPGSNQKVVFRIRARFKNTSTTPLWIACQCRITAAGNVTGGTFGAAITWNKRDPSDAETPRATWQECTANPTVSGTPTVRSNYAVNSQDEYVSDIITLNAADVLIFETTDTNSIAFDYEVDVVE